MEYMYRSNSSYCSRQPILGWHRIESFMGFLFQISAGLIVCCPSDSALSTVDWWERIVDAFSDDIKTRLCRWYLISRQVFNHCVTMVTVCGLSINVTSQPVILVCCSMLTSNAHQIRQLHVSEPTRLTCITSLPHISGNERNEMYNIIVSVPLEYCLQTQSQGLFQRCNSSLTPIRTSPTEGHRSTYKRS